MLSEGHQLFVQKGCAACHGAEGEGSAVAPALPGHTREAVLRQVRNPLFMMPAFSQDQVSDKELEKIAAWVESLGPAEGHGEPTEIEDPAVLHQWMALLALKAGTVEEAKHHVQHVIDTLGDQDPDRAARMRQVLALLDEGELHKAEHEVEEMLAGVASPDLTLATMHLELALSAIAGHDRDDAIHHIEHFLSQATGQDREDGEVVLRLLKEGDLHQAEHELGDLLARIKGEAPQGQDHHEENTPEPHGHDASQGGR